MAARIYKPAKNAMQQGTAPREWVLEFEPDKPLEIEPLMGWTSATDTKPQVKLTFASKEEAIAFATRHGIGFRLEEPREVPVRPKSYAENFKFGRPDRWTH
ncbi:MAG TPA: ETC complex I subunit [Methyloceanibacter sp.]|nr:ETC complex I subunit [Methyloceanibacter sp.]